MSANLTSDLDKTIANAVNARVEASVLAALSGDDVLGRYVAAALSRTVEVPDERGYGKTKVRWIDEIVASTIRDAVKEGVKKALTDEESEIAKATARLIKREASSIADQLVKALTVATAKSVYGIKVELSTRGN